MSFVNPGTGKPIKQGAATWRRLIAGGHRVVVGRLLRHEHVDVEALAIEVMGHPLNLPTKISNERLAVHMADLEMVRNPPEAENKQPKPDPLTDNEVDSVVDDLYDIRWTVAPPTTTRPLVFRRSWTTDVTTHSRSPASDTPVLPAR